MKLILLGTAGFMPTDQAQTACFMLPEVGVLLDAGTGLYRMPAYLQTPELDVYLTHAHGDHTRGLVFLFAAFFVNEVNLHKSRVSLSQFEDVKHKAIQRMQTARLHATQPAIDELSKEYASNQLDWRLIQPHETLPCGGRLTAFPVGNADEIGFRLDWPGHSMAYVTDTIAAPDAPYMEQIRGVDLLLHDCNGPDRLSELMTHIHHSSTLAVAWLAAQAQVRRLILVHKNPIRQWSLDEDLDAARAIFPATEIGMDQMEVEF